MTLNPDKKCRVRCTGRSAAWLLPAYIHKYTEMYFGFHSMEGHPYFSIETSTLSGDALGLATFPYP